MPWEGQTYWGDVSVQAAGGWVERSAAGYGLAKKGGKATQRDDGELCEVVEEEAESWLECYFCCCSSC